MKLPDIFKSFKYMLPAAGVACIALAGAMAAQDTSKSQATQGQTTVQVKVERGEVVYVSGNDLVVKMENGEVRHFVVPDERRITVEGRELSIHDLKPGMKLERTITTTATPEVVTTVRTIQGTVWQVKAPKSVILTLPDGTNKEYKVPKDQKFMIGGEEKTVFDLRKGMTVSATVITQVPETRIAETRKVTGKMPPPPPTPPMEGAMLIEEAPAPTVPPPPAETAQAQPAPEKKLPATASPLPLMGLLGALMLAAGLGLRMVRLRAH